MRRVLPEMPSYVHHSSQLAREAAETRGNGQRGLKIIISGLDIKWLGNSWPASQSPEDYGRYTARLPLSFPSPFPAPLGAHKHIRAAIIKKFPYRHPDRTTRNPSFSLATASAVFDVNKKSSPDSEDRINKIST